MSYISLHTNLMAADTANALNQHYLRLTESTRRLSTGLRINSADDDAAGLAIRELMRSDIAALRQGARNVNDAISLIQTFDGALGIIDEKLIRMKELAEQAATGTYDSTQRLMIDSEFQAMGDEIDRIARATDFNGIKMLDGLGVPSSEPPTVTASVSPGFTLSPSSDDIQKALGADAAPGIYNFTFSNGFFQPINGSNLFLKVTGGTPGATTQVSVASNVTTTLPDGSQVFNDMWTFEGGSPGNIRLEAVGTNSVTHNGITYTVINANGAPTAPPTFANQSFTVIDSNNPFTASNGATLTAQSGTSLAADVAIGGSTVSVTIDGNNAAARSISLNIKLKASSHLKIHFGPGNSSAEDYYYLDTQNCTRAGLGLEGVDIQTQDKAQKALVTIDDAMVLKDQARAYFGAMQNRLENTYTNITTQAENLQSAESRLSDADIAQEMTEFVRSQILTNSAVAMLSQANSMPQMLMSLLD